MQWVKQLDANEFDERDEATRHLVRIGSDAIDLIVKMIPEAGNEAKIRAIHVLRTLALSNDETVALAAEQALDQMIKKDDYSLSVKALNAMAYVGELREEIALEQLQRLGAKLVQRTMVINNQFQQVPYTITFDDEWNGENTDFRRLRWLTGIREIEVQGAKFTDETISYLSLIPQADTLRLKKCAITNKAIGFLKDINQLTTIEIIYCQITDDCIKDLAAVKYGFDYKLYGTKISREAAESLLDGKAVAKVDYRKGALLGIACPIGSTNCVISTVQPDSAADKAGIEVGDEILKFNGEKVTNMQELTARISNLEVGDEVAIEWKRDEAILQGKVTLGAW